ncbi:hypothetical protein A9Q83_05345 [Alphaproteobacteria bacterium 46_93_T64]|nr:hypothetical protein A9Q83_05345 [Alphaproteobacteria bacterium 46_93_T64]
MKKLYAAIVVTSVLGMSLPAQAGQCPNLMKQIDAAMSNSNISLAQMATVKELRAKGGALHKSGGHPASVASLKEAMKILGIM